ARGVPQLHRRRIHRLNHPLTHLLNRLLTRR
ncbi:MAG: hypothetical protein QOG57_747, partial [Pseudonocardiales bacterium]|nr:hypothetical protein [Pseudonocardiales bacterium]